MTEIVEVKDVTTQLATFACIIGVIELLIGLPLLVRPKATMDWLLGWIKSADATYRLVGGALLIIVVLVLWNDWSLDWSLAGLIKLLAYLTGIKSLIICWWPRWQAAIAEKFWSIGIVQPILGVLATVVGVLLLWAAVVLG